ncbi:hypothetical protein VTI28DRAFT_8149 [Corynascus sepedonium]
MIVIITHPDIFPNSYSGSLTSGVVRLRNGVLALGVFKGVIELALSSIAVCWYLFGGPVSFRFLLVLDARGRDGWKDGWKGRMDGTDGRTDGRTRTQTAIKASGAPVVLFSSSYHHIHIDISSPVLRLTPILLRSTVFFCLLFFFFSLTPSPPPLLVPAWFGPVCFGGWGKERETQRERGIDHGFND